MNAVVPEFDKYFEELGIDASIYIDELDREYAIHLIIVDDSISEYETHIPRCDGYVDLIKKWINYCVASGVSSETPS